MNKNQIIEEINHVFADTVYPEEASIVEYPKAYEYDEIYEFFKGKKWQGFDLKQLAYENSAPSFLLPIAFCYYLPAYMLLIIEDISLADVLVMSVLDKLTLPQTEDIAKHNAMIDEQILRAKDPSREIPGIKGLGIENVDFLKKLIHTEEDLKRETGDFNKMANCLSKEQGMCVRHFLGYIDQANPGYFDEGEIKTIIDRYWKKFKD